MLGEFIEIELETNNHFNDEKLLSKAVLAQIILGDYYDKTLNDLDTKP